MTNATSLNPVLIDPEFFAGELPADPMLQKLPARKPGPVRVLPISSIDWGRIQLIQPHPESPIHD